MSKLNTLEELLVHQIKDIFSAENQLLKALPKMAKASNHPELKAGFNKHLEETKGHVERLELVAKELDASPRGVSCKAMKGLIEEGEETIQEEAAPHIKDLALIAAAQKVEHYEISAYGSARALAKVIGNSEVVKMLDATLNEESATDEALTGLAETIMPLAQEEAVEA